MYFLADDGSHHGIKMKIPAQDSPETAEGYRIVECLISGKKIFAIGVY
jgi:hypothetical protein